MVPSVAPCPAYSDLGCRDSWRGRALTPSWLGSPLTAPFSFQILGAVILGFGVWILADKSSFISVLRKNPSASPEPGSLEKGGPGRRHSCSHQCFGFNACCFSR